jgi:hypothetical protein
MQDQVARHFEDEIADEEDAGAQTVDGVAHVQGGQHLQLREADVHAVEIPAQVAQHDERHDAPADPAVYVGARRRRHQ